MENIIGAKFYTFNDKNEVDIRRVYEVDKENNRVKYIDQNKYKKSMSYDELLSNYKLLKGDGIMTFSIVGVQDLTDVIVSLQKFNSDSNMPYAICRQSIYDVFTNKARKNEYIEYVGVSISQDTCPAEINFKDLLQCDSLKYNRVIIIYMDDTLDDILRLFSSTKYDNALRVLHQACSRMSNYRGYNDTLRELLINNNFMYDFRKCFNIIDLPYVIEGDELSVNNVEELSKILKINISNTYVIKYDRSINTNNFQRSFVYVTDPLYKDVYIIGYDVIKI